MNSYIAEMVGTMVLVLLGDGVVANVILSRTKGHAGGCIAITTGWGLAVAVAAYTVGTISGGHINPAVTVGLAVTGKFDWGLVPGYLAAQFVGAFLGAVMVWLAYWPHWKATPDPATKLGVFCTVPAIRHYAANFLCELVGTAVLVLGILAMTSKNNLVPETGFSTGLGPFLVGLLVWSIGLSLGGPTGYAINPARDLGPRLAHWVLPVAGKGGSDFAYAWVPVVGPLAGGVAGAWLHRLLWPA